MMSSSFGTILRATGITGGSSVVNAILGLLRTKIAALVLGPAGIGIIGILTNLVNTAATLFACGIGSVATRSIAEAGEDPRRLAAARAAILWAAPVLAFGGGLAVWLLRVRIAELLFGGGGWSEEVGWMAIGVTLTVALVAQNGVLIGYRRIGDLARVSILSALVTTILGSAALLIWRERALVAFVLLTPAATFLAGAWLVRNIPNPAGQRLGTSQLGRDWKTLACLGLTISLGGVFSSGSQLLVRGLVHRELGSVGVGQYQAAFLISLTYIGFILNAMGTDYYPRLTAAISNKATAGTTINHQAEVALLLASPMLVAMTAAAPWVIKLLYSSEFTAAATVLRWQLAGDLLKISSWPLGFILLASGRGQAFMLTELAAGVIFVGVTAVALPTFGIEAPGVAYVAMYVCYLPMVYAIARAHIGFSPSPGVLRAFAAAGSGLIVTLLACSLSDPVGFAVGSCVAFLLAVLAAVRLHHALPEPITRRTRKLATKFRLWLPHQRR